MKKQYQTVTHGGADVHYRFSKVTLRDEKGKVVARERLEHADRAGLRRQLSGWPEGTEVVLEASFGWGWLSDEMLAAGLQPRLSNCLKVERMRKARGWAKTNQKDADLLSLLPEERTNWWEVWLAPPAVRDRREWMRYRTDLVQVQTAAKCRIQAVFHRHGVFHEFSDLFGSAGRMFLAALCKDGGGQLSGGALEALRGQVRLLDHVRQELAWLTRVLRQQLERTPLARLLDGIPGIGLVLSHTLMAEIGRIDRFRDHRRLASYSLLAPMSVDTGEKDRRDGPLGRHLGRRGNRTLKWAFIEAAHGAVRKGGRWRAMFDRYTEGGKRHRNRGYIKVARELVKVVYVVWSQGREYTETPPPRPGSQRRQGNSRKRGTRPGTGQPSRPMVAAE